MSVVSTVTVTVPATTANLGPGFDCIGAALTLYNRFKFSRLGDDTPLEEDRAIRIKLTTAPFGVLNCGSLEQVKSDSSNLVYQTFAQFYHQIGQTPPPIQIEIFLGYPLTRGLGSSSTAIAGGLLGANALAGSPLSLTELIQLAIAIEGHPDNVVPAFLGGCCLAATRSNYPDLEPGKATCWEICDIPWHSDIIPVLAVPNFELLTAESRRVLPANYSRAESIFNTSHLGLLLRGLETGNPNWLRSGLQDCLHQPYRKSLIPGYDTVVTAALQAGAYGVVISGAGPTLLALTNPQSAQSLETAIAIAWKSEGILAEVRSLNLDTQGATIVTEHLI